MGKRNKDYLQNTNPEINSISSDIVHSKRVRRQLLKRRLAIIAAIVLVALLAVTGVAYWLMNMVERQSMKIGIDRQSLSTFALSKTESFNESTSVLEISGPEDMDEIAYADVYYVIQKALNASNPELTEQERESYKNYLEGEFHGRNYYAFAFYIRNNADAEEGYKEFIEKVTLDLNTQNLGYSIRVFLAESEADGSFKEENINIYGMADADGNANLISTQQFRDPQTAQPIAIGYATPFESDSVICNKVMRLKGGDYKRIVVFIWSEGSFTDDGMEYGYISVGFKYTGNE